MPGTEIPLSEIREDSLVRVERGETKIVVIRSQDKVYAFHDRCPHAFWPLSQGTLSKKVLECAGHGWEFDIETGRCLNAPVYCLSPLAVSVEGDTVRLQWF